MLSEEWRAGELIIKFIESSSISPPSCFCFFCFVLLSVLCYPSDYRVPLTKGGRGAGYGFEKGWGGGRRVSKSRRLHAGIVTWSWTDGQSVLELTWFWPCIRPIHFLHSHPVTQPFSGILSIIYLFMSCQLNSVFLLTRYPLALWIKVSRLSCKVTFKKVLSTSCNLEKYT